jgi:hypothetical protein
MPRTAILAKAWNNGSHHPSGASYGIKIGARDRDSLFRREWKTVKLYLPNQSSPIVVNIDKDSFWNSTCRELISHEIGVWLKMTGLAPWPLGESPSLRLVARSERSFDLSVHGSR